MLDKKTLLVYDIHIEFYIYTIHYLELLQIYEHLIFHIQINRYYIIVHKMWMLISMLYFDFVDYFPVLSIQN